MENIAQKFGINVSQLRHVNGLSGAKQLKNAQAVLVPANYSPNDEASSINFAEMENYSANAAEENADKSEKTKTEPKLKSPVTIKVKRGDTLQGLAREHNTSASALMQFNELKTSKVSIGQMIKINQIAENNKSEFPSNNRKIATTNRKVDKLNKNKAQIIKIKSKNVKATKSKIRLKTKQI